MDKLVLVNEYPYHVRIEGAGEPTWLFFHGFMGSLADYEQVKPAGTRIYLDLLGFGGQTPAVARERFDATNQALDIVLIRWESTRLIWWVIQWGRVWRWPLPTNFLNASSVCS